MMMKERGERGIEMKEKEKRKREEQRGETWCITLQKMIFLDKSSGLLLSLKNLLLWATLCHASGMRSFKFFQCKST